MMEMQVDLEPASDICRFRGDNCSNSRCSSDWMDDNKSSPQLEADGDNLPRSNSGALSDRVALPLAPHREHVESSSAAPSKALAYCRQWDLAIPGVYIPSGSSYNLHCEGKNPTLQISEHSKNLQVPSTEETFILLVDSSDDENLQPQRGRALPFHSKKHNSPFQNLSRMQAHKELQADRNSHPCPLCGKKFLRVSNLRMHKLTHSTERPHKCPVCSKGFFHTADVWRHLYSLHKIKRSSVVLGSADTRNHWSVAQQDLDSSWRPEQPGYAAKDPGDESSKCHLCPVCSKGFRNANLLSKHKVIHRKEKPYVCKECGMAFVQLARLKRHHQTHTGERPFSCELCAKSFTRLSSLQRHQRIHTGEKPYSCSYCSLSFAVLGTLKRHEQIHQAAPTQRSSR